MAAFSESVKRYLLDVDAQALTTYGLISAETARQMAIGCRSRLATDFALAITECPSFEPDEAQALTPTAFIAFATEDSVEVREHTLIGDPGIRKSRAAKTALNLLRLHLLEI